MFDIDLTEENIEELRVRLSNLQYLFKLRDAGYDIKECLFAYCGCGSCTNEPFVASTIMLIFDIEDESDVQLVSDDFDVWAENHPGLEVDNSLTEVVIEIYVQDIDADKELIPVILSSYTGNSPLMIEVIDNDDIPAWHVVIDSWNSADEDILDLFLHIKQICLSQEVAA